ncbi:hypothetical protein BDM02DRAFT_3263379 [Thelephora ganbajun]|uniref:Uncharacterized protein n=1 Tax=Thelephora ganbajun TaxID=370292 RepID=A0ACB6Z5T1_THEGA|nr:hypothetical protein BDM02DRAFT_3263379 [Thelephora ganbajun]
MVVCEGLRVVSGEEKDGKDTRTPIWGGVLEGSFLETVLQETSSGLERQIGVARRIVLSSEEHPGPRRTLTPGLLYVGISALAGSIFMRFVLPSTSTHSKTNTSPLLPRGTLRVVIVRPWAVALRARRSVGPPLTITHRLKFTEVLGWGKGIGDKALVTTKEIVEQKVEHVEEKLPEDTRKPP